MNRRWLRTVRDTCKLGCLLAAAIAAIAGAGAARAEEVVLPVAVYARGVNYTSWAGEVRVTNRGSTALTFRVVDFVGTLGMLPFSPADFSVAPGTTASWGAYDLLSAPPSECLAPGVINPTASYYGALVLNVSPGLIVESAVLAGPPEFSCGDLSACGAQKCKSWEGGYIHPSPNPCWCNEGAGPIFEGTATFYAPGAQIFLPWLHTQPSRRTNLTFYNPDTVDAAVALTIASGDGFSSQTNVSVPAHSVRQLNDVFSSPPFDVIRTHNGDASATATATISSTTRLYSIGWVISNANNTVSIAVPR